MVPHVRPRTGILLQWSREWEQDQEFKISSPANETGPGPYLVPGMRPRWESRRALKWGNGIGAFLPPGNWAYATYGFRINGPGVDKTGKKMCHKMSDWELAGPLLLLCSMHYRQLIFWVDNSGAVMMFEKGYSTKCNL